MGKSNCSKYKLQQIYVEIILTEGCLEEGQSTSKLKESDLMKDFKVDIFLKHQAPVVQRLDSTIHWINLYPANSVICFANTYPLDRGIHLLNNWDQI